MNEFELKLEMHTKSIRIISEIISNECYLGELEEVKLKFKMPNFMYNYCINKPDCNFDTFADVESAIFITENVLINLNRHYKLLNTNL